MTKNNKIFLTVFIILLIGLLALYYWYNQNQAEFQDSPNGNQDQENQEVKIDQTFKNKVVYENTDQPALIEAYQQDCQSRNGEFNECGSPCGPDVDFCAEVCAYTCVFPQNEPNDKTAWSIYENNDLHFAVMRPDNMTTESLPEQRVELQIIGDQQKPATEITDGLRIVVERQEKEAHTSLKEVVNQEIEEIVPNIGQVIQTAQLDNDYQLATYNYTIETIGEYTHYIMPIHAGAFFDISVFTTNAEYQAIAQRLLNSFKIQDPEYRPAKINDLITVDNPRPGQTISSPTQITGQARGNWFFEGQFSLNLVDWDGRIIGEAIATAQDEWMTENFVQFTANLDYEKDSDLLYPNASLILEKSNPSGLPENDQALEYTVYLE